MRRIVKEVSKVVHNLYRKSKMFDSHRTGPRRIRKYADLNVTKQFQKHQAQKDKEVTQRLKHLYDLYETKQLEATSSQEKQVIVQSYEEQKSIILQEQENPFQYEAVTGLKKQLVLGVIRYHQFQEMLFEDTTYHPETKKMLEILHFQVENNLPVKKEVGNDQRKLLFKTVPELYVEEINKMEPQFKDLYPRPQIGFYPVEGKVLEHNADENKALNSLERVTNQKLIEMENYLEMQIRDVWKLYHPMIEEEIERGKHPNLEKYLQILSYKRREKRKDFENKFLDELDQIRQIQEDIKALREKALDDVTVPQFYLEVPQFIRDPFVVQMYKDLLAEELARPRARTHEFLPPVPDRGPSFYQRLRKEHGAEIDQMIEEERQHLQYLADTDQPLPAKDLYKKDETLLKQVNLLAKAVKVQKRPQPKIDLEWQEKYMTEELLRQELPTPGKMLVDDYYKLLKFNNDDPSHYDITFWSEFFEIDESTLRNIFNYTAFPVPHPEDPSKVAHILQYMDEKKAEDMKLIAGMTQEQLEDFVLQRRMELFQEERMKGIGAGQAEEIKLLPSSALQEYKQTHLSVEEQVRLQRAEEREERIKENEELRELLADRSVLEKIDAEIAEIVKK